MKKSKIIWGIIIFILIMLGIFIYSKTIAITSYDECRKAEIRGNGIILEWCKTLDGRKFYAPTITARPCVVDPSQIGC